MTPPVAPAAPPGSAAEPARSPRRPHLLLALAFFVFVWGAKLVVLDRFASDLPFWDQWEREGAHVLRTWTESGDTLRALFAPHNEHRIAPTLGLNFALAALSGQWDARVQCVASAALQSALLAGLFLWALRHAPLRWALFAGGILAALGAAPVVWENLLSGFQSQFHFLAGFSLLALFGLLGGPTGRVRPWLGGAAGLLALVRLGSGFFWTLPVLLVSALQLRATRRADGPPAGLAPFVPLAVAGAALSLGLLLHTGTAGHDALRAPGLGAALVYAARCLSWPWPDLPWLSVLLWSPWLVFAFSAAGSLRRRRPLTGSDAFLLAAGLWLLLQVAAVAYARGGADTLPANRYGDLCGLGLALSALALARLAPRLPEPLPFAALWALLVVPLLAAVGTTSWSVFLPARHTAALEHERHVHAFVLSDDFATFEKQELPFPNPQWLAEVLRHPGVRALLPASIRAPLPIPGWAGPAAPPGPTPPLPHRAVRTVTSTEEWRSAELPASGGYWKIETAGHLGAPGTSLQLVAVRDGRVLGSVVPSRQPGHGWRAVHVPAPREPARLVARTDSAERWFAFSEPVHVAALSERTRVALKSAWLLPLLGAALFLPLAWRLRARRFSGLAPAPGTVPAGPPPPRRFATAPALLAAFVAAVVLVVPFLPASRSSAQVFAFEARVRSEASGNFQIYYDRGEGIAEHHSGRAALVPGRTTVLTIPIAAGNYRLLRIDPVDGPGIVTLESLRLVSLAGWTIADLPLAALKPHHQIARATLADGALRIESTPDADDPQLLLEYAPPLAVAAGWRDYFRGSWRYILPFFAVLATLLALADRAPRTRAALARFAAALGRRPAAAVGFAAAVAVVVSAYPVVFLGKSFVSPNYGTPLLYDRFPTLPGYRDAATVDAKMSDVGAIIWQHVPFSMLQGRALAGGELPLWNRYNAAGVPLLAQGQSMFGDPLHLFVVAAGGAAWAWDAKYLVAKWLFATGLALCVLALVSSPALARLHPPDQPGPVSPNARLSPLVAALPVALSAPFIGFFLYRINHPAFFSLCYAPWPLYCFLRLADLPPADAEGSWFRRHRALLRRAAALVVANLAVMNSGTVKEAYMLLLGVNLAGAALLAASVLSPAGARPATLRARFVPLLPVLAGAGLLFVLLTSPLWATFLATLRHSYTGYNAVSAYQIQPTLLLGLFDEIFYRPLMGEDRVFNPSLNFLLLLGFLWFLVTLRSWFAHRAAVAIAAVSLLPLGLAFGLVSPHWIVRVPFLANVAHVDNTFSCVLLVLWSVLAGLGFAAAARRLGTPAGRQDLVLVLLLLGALVFGWLAFGHAAHRPIVGPTVSVNPPGETLPVTPFIHHYLVALLLGVGLLLGVLHRAAARGRLGPASALLLALAAAMLLWRHGWHAPAAGFEAFTARPPARAPFDGRSAAVEFVRAAHAREPARGYGFHGNFFPGWTGVYGLETVHGPDALVNPWLRELTGVSGANRIWDWRLYTEPAGLAAVQPFFDALNVRYYFDQRSGDPALPGPLRLAHRADLDVYESPTAWPRAFFVRRLGVYDDPAELVSRFAIAAGRPFAAIQRPDLAARPELAPLAATADSTPDMAAVPAGGYRLTENDTSFRVRADGPGVIVLTETWWPEDIVAELNGRPAPVLRVNHAFRGVVVPAAGDYTVRVRYWPKNFGRHLALSLAAAGTLLGAVFLTFRRRSASGRPAPVSA